MERRKRITISLAKGNLISLMNPKVTILYLLFLSFIVNACFEEQEIPVVTEFSFETVEGFTVPVTLAIKNETTGATFYQWTFQGATPETSDKKQPGSISYDQPGNYTIKLEAWNDTQRQIKEISVRIDSAVTIDFDANVLVNHYSPVQVEIVNNTEGASSYEWLFEGGDPATSTDANPSVVTFSEPGEHTITLNVTNGSETFTTTRTIIVEAALAADFEIAPSFEDQDLEAPLTASLTNTSINGVHYAWSTTGGAIANAAAENTSIHFTEPGDYTITLTVDNDKETKSASKTFQVKPNSNLLTLPDVKLGVNAAHSTIGSFYATPLRQVLKKTEVTEDNGNAIDLIFYGINSTFAYCRFISPDSASKFAFPAIPNARHVYFVNNIASSGLTFSASDFNDMVNDVPLRPLNIKESDTGISFFTNATADRIILFETDDGRKGAIKIKQFTAEGTQSYIIVDIKVQKLKP
jgi:PKD repeat protein